ncbi:MAG: ATP-binding cassette domain-containing protein [Acidobacteria bacterium]|nr:ATP-binding cassette domain-containing protein [Acidobacteriota bacterium]
MITTRELTKVYRVPLKEPGLWNSVRSLWNREYREVRAVDGIDLEIETGERVGFLGPNGAGKTTTLKMLTGLLHPTAGSCEVAGFTPSDRRADFLRSVTLVMGQKQQLLWDLPPTETFALNRALLGVSHADYRAMLDELVDLLDLGEFMDQPARNLSLGQRMRCELAAALLHRPRVLFLDEPTIGLDVQVQRLVRGFIKEYQRRHEATVMLTSHDMDDVGSIAERIVLIDHGVIHFDGPLDRFKRTFGGGRRLVARHCRGLDDLGFVEDEPGRHVATVGPADVNGLLAEVLRRFPEAEVTVEDPPLEEVLETAFSRERAEAQEE